MKAIRFDFKLRVVISVMVLLLCTTGYAGNIDPNNDGSKYAYGENVGWINFEPLLGNGVTVTDDAVAGYAWSENIGWINLSPVNGGVVNDGAGNLSGYAWGENVGWINFAPTGAGVSIDPSTGEFSGYAWGENVGWIAFAPNGGGVKTLWKIPDAGGDDGTDTSGDDTTENGGVGGGSGCFATILNQPF